jgi:Rps23 Pro-64 3,4-dihydroxylase Tpa1-like proline 4-hydroxylase
MIDIINNIDKKITLDKDPFDHTIINNFLPENIIRDAEKEFSNFDQLINSQNQRYEKLKSGFNEYSKLPLTIKKIIDFFYSDQFIKVLEQKFNIDDIEPDWSLAGGGMHQSFNGGHLKIHSDFLYKRKSKQRRVLNLLLYLNSNWKEEWNGSLELWDKNMKSCKKKISPMLNNCVIFRTDKESNHGFPDPITCPSDVKRKSIAIYYYVKEKNILPITIKKRKLFHAVWKKRPNVEEPVFGDQNSFFKKIKNKFFFRFF